MADIKMEFDKREMRELNRYLAGVRKNVGNLRPVMVFAVSVMANSVALNFRMQGRPPFKWPGLKESTIKARQRRGTWPGTILEEFGALKQSLSVGIGGGRTRGAGGRFVSSGKFVKILNNSAEFGTTLLKARTLQFGAPERSGVGQVPEHQRTRGGKTHTVRAHERSFRFGAIPKRPFIYWRNEDIRQIMGFAASFAFQPDVAKRFGTVPKVTSIPKALFLGVGS